MQKKGLADNRNWFVFIVCTISSTIAVLGTVFIFFNLGKEAMDTFTMAFNIIFITFWVMMILAEKKIKKLHLWMINENDT